MPTNDDKLWKKLKKDKDITICRHVSRPQRVTNKAVVIECYGKKWYHVEWYKLCKECYKTFVEERDGTTRRRK